MRLGKLGEKIKSFFLYDGLKKEEYKLIEKDIRNQNRKNLIKANIILLFISLFLLIMSFILEKLSNARIYIFLSLIYTILFILVLSTIAKKNLILSSIINLLFTTMVFILGIYLGTVAAKGGNAINFCVCLAILPFVTYEIVLRNLLHRILICTFFIYIDSKFKTPIVVMEDFVNVVIYGSIGIVVSGFSQQVQAKAYFLRYNMRKEINYQTKKVRKLSLQSMIAMADAIDAKDNYTNGHSMRVAKYSVMIANRIGKSEEEQNNIYYIAMLHDVGKIGIPDSIINKISRLTDDEYAKMKSHSSIGYDILKKVEELPGIAIGARFHHERYDGKGYPLGLKGEKIPEIARIIAVADSYDAMTSNRSYREIMPQEKVRSEIEKGKGTQFDPQFADVMLEIIDEDINYTLHE